jgi:exodeoxyribonuclease VII small subunit
VTDESYSFSTARARLEDIVAQVRKKDTSLEKSLDLLEEGVKLANACTELIDHQDWIGTPATEAAGGEAGAAEAQPGGETIVVDGTAVIEDVVVTDDDGEFVAEVIEVTQLTAETPSADAFAAADDAWADESEAVADDEPGEPYVDEE